MRGKTMIREMKNNTYYTS